MANAILIPGKEKRVYSGHPWVFRSDIARVEGDFTPGDIIHIINHSESKLLFLGDNFWDIIEEDQIRQIEAVFSLTDFHAIYERNGKALTKFQRDILKNYRSKYPRGFSVNDIKYLSLIHISEPTR